MRLSFLLVIIITSCRVANSSQHVEPSHSDGICCKIYENTQPVDFSKMKAVLENNNSHLLDVYTVERTSGRPDLDVTLHFFKTEAGIMMFEQKIGQKPVKHFITNDTSIYSPIRAIGKKHYYQQCYNDRSTLLVNKLFEVKSQGIILQSCYLTNGGSENICDEDKRKILVVNKLFEQMRQLAKAK